MASSRRGVWLVIILISFALMVSAGGLMFFALLGGAPASVPSNATLYLDLRAPLPEVAQVDIFSALSTGAPTLRETVGMIRGAKDDDRVTAMVLTVQAPGALWGQLQELRDALADFRTSGKQITAYMEYGGAAEYFVASVADRVVLMPAGQLDLAGLATYELFFRGLFDKIGVVPDMLQIGEYKTAANTYTERGFTAAHREMSQSLASDWFSQIVDAVAESRGVSAAEARAALTGGPYGADEALAAGLVDALAYEDELDDEAPIRETRRLTDDAYWRATEYRRPGATSGRIALLYASGTIASGGGSSDLPGGQVVGSATFSEWLRRVRVDPTIRAVVVRVDSPGGSAIASEVIWRELMLTREVKPLVVSMGDVAASGGYYMAAPAHAIVAQPGTLTGSIGVVTGKFVLEGTLDKLGIGIGAVSEGPNAEIFSPFRPFTPAERSRVQAQMRATYDLFLSRVAEGRNRTVEEIDTIGQGRVWTGQQALELGLVDQLGGLETAITLARDRAKLDPALDVNLVIYPRKRSIYEIVANPLGTAAELVSRPAIGLPWNHRGLEAVSSWFTLFRRAEPLTLMPNVFFGGI